MDPVVMLFNGHSDLRFMASLHHLFGLAQHLLGGRLVSGRIIRAIIRAIIRTVPVCAYHLSDAPCGGLQARRQLGVFRHQGRRERVGLGDQPVIKTNPGRKRLDLRRGGARAMHLNQKFGQRRHNLRSRRRAQNT